MYAQELISPNKSVCCSPRLSNNSSRLAGVIYRKPTADIEFANPTLEGLYRYTRLGCTHILILGDFHHFRANFAEHMYIEGNNSTKARFSNPIEDLELVENVKLAARSRDNQTPPLLVCAFTNEKLLISTSYTWPHWVKLIMPF